MNSRTANAAVALLLALSAFAPAQEPELVTEIVARVNNAVITRGDYLGALRDLEEELTRQLREQGRSDADVKAEYDRLKPTVIDLMIDDILLEQKAKELGIEVEADVNQQMAEIGKQNGFKNVIDFENALKNQGVDPEAARSSLRKRFQQQYVVQREVLQPIYQSISEKEKRAFYEENKEKFKIPGKMTLSEIFLPLEGHTAAEVEQRARRLIAELRAGGSFTDAVQKNSPLNRPSRAQGGKMGEFLPSELRKEVAAAVSALKVGEVTEPIRLQDGYQIIRLDEHKADVLRKYEDSDVERLIAHNMTMQRAEEARKKYLARLRQEAYIRINPDYAPQAPSKAEEAKNKN